MGWAACDFLVPCENTEKFVVENEWYEQSINHLSLKTSLDAVHRMCFVNTKPHKLHW